MCGDDLIQEMKNEIGIAERLEIITATLENIFSVRGQRMNKRQNYFKVSVKSIVSNQIRKKFQ